MERIKKALQLASEERSGALAQAVVAPFRDEARPFRDGEILDFKYAQTRVLEVPQALFERNRIVTGHGQDPVTTAYKLLRTQALQRLDREGWQTVAVVSPGAGEGKTLTAINLAISIGSSRSHTALLVDLDWRRPSVHKYFDYHPEHDLGGHLRGEHGLEAVLVNPGLSRFCFLPCSEPVDGSSEQLASLGSFVAGLKARYRNRIILFDLPPLLGIDDAISFLPHVDCVLLVVQEGKTRRQDVARCLELVDRETLLGTVINRSRQAPEGY